MRYSGMKMKKEVSWESWGWMRLTCEGAEWASSHGNASDLGIGGDGCGNILKDWFFSMFDTQHQGRNNGPKFSNTTKSFRKHLLARARPITVGSYQNLDGDTIDGRPTWHTSSFEVGASKFFKDTEHPTYSLLLYQSISGM